MKNGENISHNNQKQSDMYFVLIKQVGIEISNYNKNHK